MNIFVLDMDYDKNVQSYVDKHVIKMPLETAQILCSTYYCTDQPELATYKLTHKNHPCCKWARESLSNWIWLRNLGIAICREYTYRYGKHHKCEQIILDMKTPNLPDIGLTSFAQDMPEECRGKDPIEAYRKYYNCKKSHLFNWKNRDIPEWVIV